MRFKILDLYFQRSVTLGVFESTEKIPIKSLSKKSKICHLGRKLIFLVQKSKIDRYGIKWVISIKKSENDSSKKKSNNGSFQ